MKAVSTMKIIACTLKKRSSFYLEKSVDILQLRYRPGVEKEFRSSEEFNKVTAAIKSIPSQLHFCYSSIPGAGFGICATETIPSGTWIGPYEGKRVSIDEIGSLLDTRYLWEVGDHHSFSLILREVPINISHDI